MYWNGVLHGSVCNIIWW